MAPRMENRSTPTQPSKLKVGLLLDSYQVPSWFYRMLSDIQKSDSAELSLVILNDKPQTQRNHTLYSKLKNNSHRLGYLITRRILELLYEKLIERTINLDDAESLKNSSSLLNGVPSLSVKTKRKKWSDYFYPEDVDEIKNYDLDILIRGGFGILRGEILSSAKHGVWSYHHGDNHINRGGPAGFWESMESWPETGAILQILTEDLDNGTVLYRSFSCTNTMSVTDNRSNYYWKSVKFMTRKINELYTLGADDFFINAKSSNRHPNIYSEKLYVQPNNWDLALLTWNKLVEKTKLLINNHFFFNQWILMFDIKEEFSSSLWRYKKILPPKDRFWADPHVITRDNKYYIFIEELLYSTNKGHISLIEMDEKGNYTPPVKILDRPYHLSYPFVFEHDNELYMIPETAENRTIELYKCTSFPDQWELETILMEDIHAVDATLHYHENKWWLFANMIEIDGASDWDELFLFSSENLASNQWQAHPQNPIVSDVKTARPAGRIFEHNGGLYRPSQNCSHHYGYGFNFNEITQLSSTDYKEQLVSEVKPNWDKNIIGTHTFCRSGSLHVIDALYRRKKR